MFSCRTRRLRTCCTPQAPAPARPTWFKWKSSGSSTTTTWAAQGAAKGWSKRRCAPCSRTMRTMRTTAIWAKLVAGSWKHELHSLLVVMFWITSLFCFLFRFVCHRCARWFGLKYLLLYTIIVVIVMSFASHVPFARIFRL